MIRPDDFEVIDLDAQHGALRAPGPGPRPFGARVVLVLVVVSTLLLAGTAVWYGLAARPHHVTRTVPADVFRGIDAGGCPTQERCVPDAAQFTALERAVLRWFPSADIRSDDAVTDPGLLRTYRETIVFSSSSVPLSATVECVDGGSDVESQDHATGEFATGPSVITFIRPGGPAGCSTAVTANVPARITAPIGAMRTLADDSSLYR